VSGPILFSCFPPSDMFFTVPRASGPVMIFCAPGLVFGVTEGVGPRFHLLRSRTNFRRYRGRRVPFSCFVLPDSFSCFARPKSFSTVPRASSPIFIISTPGLIFGGTKGVGSRFLILRSLTHFRWYRGVLSRFHVFRSRTCFRGYRGRRFPFSCFTRPDTFSTVSRVSGPVFMF
jgi:hypothetical protein